MEQGVGNRVQRTETRFCNLLTTRNNLHLTRLNTVDCRKNLQLSNRVKLN